MRRGFDWLLAAQILAIGSISLLVLFAQNKQIAISQLFFWIIGLAIFYIVYQLDFRVWHKWSIFLYCGSIISLIILLFLGDPIRGSVRWIQIGAARIQPSEIAKIASILILASFYKEKSARFLKNLFFAFMIILPIIVLILIQPDIGNILPILSIWLGLSLASGLRLKDLLLLLLGGLIIAVLAFELLAPYQKERINSFINPTKDPLGTGYHIIQAKIAVGSGQFFGRGLGRGSQSQLKFLPESESDFIFASISEQLGFLGAGLLIILYILVFTRLTSYINSQIQRSGQLVIIGTVYMLLSQIFVNIGMNMGLLPVTGITLPLVSAGGSSLVAILIILGIIFSINRSVN